MPQKTVFLVFILLLTATLSAKDKVIVQPAYEFTNSGVYHISKIEIGKEELRMYIHITFIPHWWVKFSKKDYIEDCATGRKWYVKDIKNGEFDKEISMPNSGDSTFVLIFPKPDKSVTKINYLDDEDEDDITKKVKIFGISLNPKTKQPATNIPPEVSAWIDGELANAKRKTLMDVDGNEFFARDTSRLIGYIKGYDLRAGFSTGIINARNELTRESFSITVQIHEDGRFEGNIPMNYPAYLNVNFHRSQIYFYLEPGQTLSMLLDWEEFLIADRRRDIQYPLSDIRFAGAPADINRELTSFNSKLPEISYRKMYETLDKKTPDEIKVYNDESLADYTGSYKRLLDTEKLSERTRIILQNNYKIRYTMCLFVYAMGYTIKNKLPLEFYDFLKEIPMNDKRLLSTPEFGMFINFVEYCSPFKAKYEIVNKSMLPAKEFHEYLFDELGIPKTAEDSLFLTMRDSISIKFNLPNVTEEMRKKWIEEFSLVSQEFTKRHGEKRMEEYKKIYLDVIKQMTPLETSIRQQEITDSIYFNELKLKPGIIYDIIKVRQLDNLFGSFLMKGNKNDAQVYLSRVMHSLQESFLKEEAERLFQKNFPQEKLVPYELPESPITDYNKFVKEQELTNIY
jgi:hypothetical protein